MSEERTSSVVIKCISKIPAEDSVTLPKKESLTRAARRARYFLSNFQQSVFFIPEILKKKIILTVGIFIILFLNFDIQSFRHSLLFHQFFCSTFCLSTFCLFDILAVDILSVDIPSYNHRKGTRLEENQESPKF